MFSPREIEKAMGIDGITNRVIEFDRFHPTLMTLREIDKPVFAKNTFEFVQPGTAWTGICSDKIICCFGFHVLWEGVAEIWMVPDANLTKKKMVFHRASHKYLLFLAKKLNLWRIQAHVCTENIPGDKWIRSVYFKEEGICRRYGPDSKDYVIFGRVF